MGAIAARWQYWSRELFKPCNLFFKTKWDIFHLGPELPPSGWWLPIGRQSEMMNWNKGRTSIRPFLSGRRWIDRTSAFKNQWKGDLKQEEPQSHGRIHRGLGFASDSHLSWTTSSSLSLSLFHSFYYFSFFLPLFKCFSILLIFLLFPFRNEIFLFPNFGYFSLSLMPSFCFSLLI